MSQQIGPKVPGDVLSTDVIVLKVVLSLFFCKINLKQNYLAKEDDH